MKKLVLLLIILCGVNYAQDNFGSAKFGIYSPSAIDAGFIIGYEGGWHIDDNFLVGWSADWFHKNYVDARLVKDYNDFYGNIQSQLNELRAKTNLHSVPLMGSIIGNWQIGRRARAFVTGSTGLNVLLVFYRSYENPDDDEFQGAVDFAWRIGTGIIYELGTRSDAFVELAYHNSEPSWEFEVKDKQTGRRKTFERMFDMSGVMLRAGFRFYF